MNASPATDPRPGRAHPRRGLRPSARPSYARRRIARGTVGVLLLATASIVGAAEAQLGVDTLDGVGYRSLGDATLRVRFTSADSLAAERAFAFLSGQPPLPGVVPDLPRGVTAVLAHSPAAVDALTGGMVPEWRAGVAIPTAGVLVVPRGEGRALLDAEGRRVLRHEWAHLGLHQHLGGLRVPRWFDEGYAQWASGGFDATEAWRLRLLLALGRTPPLDSLELRWPVERRSAEAAYLLAASAVTFLLGESGATGLGIFLDRWRELRSFDAAFLRTFGLTTAAFEEDWRRHVERRYGWLFVLSRSTVMWMLLALVLLAMVRVRRAHDRVRIARLRAEEMPDRPAFWNEEGGSRREDAPNEVSKRS